MELHQLINIGSCGLHIIHHSFKTHIEVADWDIKATAKDAFQTLHNSPATRADYISVSGSNLFPLFFCATCWVEDKKVAERLQEIMSHISKVVIFWLKLPKLKQPKCKSFESVKEAVEDEWKILQPFLAKYQTQVPMISYMYSDIVKLNRSLMQIDVKHDLDACMSGQDLWKIGLNKENVYNKKFNLGFTAENKLQLLQRTVLVEKESVTNFFDDVHSFVVAILKMLEKSPIGSAVVHNASCFNPTQFLQQKRRILKSQSFSCNILSKSRFLLLLMLMKLPSSMESFLKMIWK